MASNPSHSPLEPIPKKIKNFKQKMYNNKLFLKNTSNAHWVENADNHLKEEYKEENHKIEGAVVSEKIMGKKN